MKLTVRLLGYLRHPQYGHNNNEVEVVLPEGATVRDLMTQLEIPEHIGGVVLSGGVVLNSDSRLTDGAELSVIQPIAGG